MEFTGDGLSDDLEVCFSYDQQDVGLASADCITVATPAVSKATVLAKPVNNTRHADMVLVL